MDTEVGGEVGSSQLKSRHKKGHMTNIYLTDSHEEAIMQYVKDHEEFYNKINKHVKDKSTNNGLWERNASSFNVAVKECKTWFKSQRACYRKLAQTKSDQAPKEMTGSQN